VQPLQHSDEPSGHHRAVPRRQPLPRQPASDARRLSRLSGPRCVMQQARDGDDALGISLATYVLTIWPRCFVSSYFNRPFQQVINVKKLPVVEEDKLVVRGINLPMRIIGDAPVEKAH
jgi:hypothetical protein